MSKKLYVGNLPYSVNNDSLQQMFAEFGDIEEASVVTDRYSGRSRGFGFVTFANDDDGKKAIEAMNGKEEDGRALVVNEARPKQPRPPRDDRGY